VDQDFHRRERAEAGRPAPEGQDQATRHRSWRR